MVEEEIYQNIYRDKHHAMNWYNWKYVDQLICKCVIINENYIHVDGFDDVVGDVDGFDKDRERWWNA